MTAGTSFSPRTADLQSSGIHAFLSESLAIALIASALVCWTSRYWHVAVAVTAISFVAVAWVIRPTAIKLPPHTIVVAFIGSWGFLQLLFHISVLPYLTLRAALIWSLYAVAFLLGSQVVRGRRTRDRFLNFMMWAGTALAVEAMLQLYSEPVRVFGIFAAQSTVTGTFVYRNQFAALMELLGPIALWRVRKGALVSGGLCFAAMFAATIASASRVGFVVMAAELTVFLTITAFQQRARMKLSGRLALALLALIAAASFVAGTDRIWNRLHTGETYQVRGLMLKSTAKLIRERPWFGFGLATWRAEYPRFATFDPGVVANEAHDDWAQWAAEGGIPFSLLIAILTIWLAKPAVTSVWGLGVLGVMAHSYIDYVLREPALSLLWFAMAGALTQACDQRS